MGLTQTLHDQKKATQWNISTLPAPSTAKNLLFLKDRGPSQREWDIVKIGQLHLCKIPLLEGALPYV